MPPENAAESRFVIDQTRKPPHAGGGMEAFGARDNENPASQIMALRLRRTAPMRTREYELLGNRIDQVLTPLGLGPGPEDDGSAGQYMFCPMPPGPPLAATKRVWSEQALLNLVMRPIVQALITLEERGVTHRGIRPDNVFQGAPNAPVILGCAWAEPPAYRQPAFFEPPYSAACHPAGRGNGVIADDVYALGALLLALALGRAGGGERDETGLIMRKLSQGSFAAMVGDAKPPPFIADLARNMLAEDPEHRPPPALLLDAIAARGRRVANRPPQRATRPLMVGRMAVWDARALAFAFGRETDDALRVVRTGEATQWLRRGLGDANLAVRIEELERQRQVDGPPNDSRLDATLLMRAIAQIDPLAPMCWRGVSIWPDGLGGVLAMGNAAENAAMVEVVATEVIAAWAAYRADRVDMVRARIEAQRLRGLLQARGPSGGPPRVLYALNPSLPCASPLLSAHWVSRLADLPPVLDAIVERFEDGAEPVDAHILAFIAAHGERRLEPEINGLNGKLNDAERLVAILRLLAGLQARCFPRPLPGLAAWVAARGGPLVMLWHNRPWREEVAARMNQLASAGFLAPMLALIEDPGARARDGQGALLARAERARIDAELDAIANADSDRAAYARHLGREIVAGLGLVALVVMLIRVAME
jgi:hypothetical protein